MKTGIITFHRALNYGAILQSYALEKIIKSFDIPCEIIDYRCKFIEELYKPFSVGHCADFSSKIKKCIKSPFLAQKRKAFDAFTKKYMTLTAKCSTKAELLSVCKELDTVVSGSDQVFNPEAAGGDFSYFLDFVPSDIRKIAYGGSLGYSTFPKKYEAQCIEYLKKFDSVSVREKSVCEHFEMLLGKEVQNVLDPVLAVDESVWEELSERPKNLPDKYILVYLMEGSKYCIDKAREIAKEKDCSLVLINPNLKELVKCKDFIIYPYASPEEFLGIFESAQAVVTNSFHGVAFSLVFRKEFYAEASNVKKMSRIADLLELFRLSDRVLPNNISYKVDRENVEKVLCEERKKSVAWLKDALT